MRNPSRKYAICFDCSSKKQFQQFQKLEQQKKQTDNFYIDRIDNALASEEFNKMQNMLEPLSLVSTHP